MNNDLLKLIETQINKELYSAYAYYGIAEFYRFKGYTGLHSWFVKQAKEEFEHAEKFAGFLAENGEKFDFLQISAPDYNFTNVRAPLEWQIQHEKYVTSLIDAIYKTAESVKDEKTKDFVQWYVDEQVEEEEKAEKMLANFDKAIMQGEPGLREFDEEIAYAR